MTVDHAPARARMAVPAAGLIVCLLAANAAALVAHRADIRPAYGKDGILTILVLGSDVGWPERPGDETRGRADGLHVIAVDTVAKRATIVDFPRDSLIGGTKVNAHLATGGPERIVAQMEAFSGLEIDHWALTSFLGLESLVEEMGGVTVDVERPMTSEDARANLAPGVQTLNGHDALAFSRDRKSQPRGDFDRTRNQGRLMLAAHEQIGGGQADLVSLTRLSAAFLRHTHTSILREEMIPLALLATQIAPSDVLQVPLAGSIGTTSGGASIVNVSVGDTFDRIRAGQVGP